VKDSERVGQQATADDPIIKDFLLSWGNDNMKGKSCKQENKDGGGKNDAES
jgi:hypothetical protein